MFQQRGYSLIEVLAASAIILTNLGVISAALIQYGEVSKKQQIMTLALDLESAIHTAVTDPASYDYAAGQTVDQMTGVSGAADFPVPFALPINRNGSLIATANWTAISPGVQEIFFNSQLANCLGVAFSNVCVIKLEIHKQRISIAPPTYAFAYRITINPDLQIKVASLGVKGDLAFVAADYKLFIPQYILATVSETDCVVAGDVETAGVTGLDRNTGKAICLVQPLNADTCPANHMNKGIKLVNIAGTSFKIIPVCQPMRQFSCPPDAANNDLATEIEYSMQSFDPRTFDASFPYVTPNQCVFTAANPSVLAAPISSPANSRGLDVTRACPNPPPRENYYLLNALTACTASATSTVTLGSCAPCTFPAFPYACTTWGPATTWSSGSQGFPTPNLYMSGPVPIGRRCVLQDTTAVGSRPAVCELPRASVTLPVVQGTITFAPNCTLKAGVPNTINSTATAPAEVF